jgi:S1-C subfamily serine protease
MRHACLVAFALMTAVLVLPDIATGTELPDIVDRVKPSIVAIGTYKQTDSPAFRLRGTGFVVSDDNLVATNAHVVAEPTDPAGGAVLVVQVRFAGKTELRRAKVVATAAEFDLALLRIEDGHLPKLNLKDSGTVREGQAVAFTGFPIGDALGFSPVTHRGTVSAITPVALPGGTARQLSEKLVRRLRSGTFEIFQLDATAYPGNSGSPVYEADTGDVVGIVNAVLVRGTKEAALSHPSGITYAVPANFLLELIRSVR